MKSAFSALMIAAGFSGLVIGGIHLLTKSRIDDNQQAYAAQVLKTVIPRNEIELTLQPKPIPYYTIHEAGRFIGVLLGISTEQGYNGRIEAWLAVGLEHEVLGVQTTFHQETPGLGDFINPRAQWHRQFLGKLLGEARFDLRQDGGDFDGVTGATVTSRAYTRMIQAGLDHPAMTDLAQEKDSD
jgi:Na+-translocating ferredoxin:NAD+ oxidoreductase subunit G